MSVSGVVSIPSSAGSSTVFTVTGTRTLAYAQLLQNYLDTALNNNTLNLVTGQANQGTITFAAPIVGLVNEAVVSPDQNSNFGVGDTVVLSDGYQALYDNVNGATTVIGATTGVNAIFEGTSGNAATFIDNGGNNTVTFVNGDNQYIGDTTSSAGNDIIVTGAGRDTVNTGYGLSTVDSGTGNAIINLNDTAPAAAGTFNAFVYLDDGQNTVNANGIQDQVVATAPGQVIDGGNQAADFTSVVLLPGGSGYADGNDIVNGNAGTVAVFDQSGNNSIFAGAGQLEFIGGANVAASIVGGTGPLYIFGGSGDTIAVATLANGGTTDIVAGTGNETLNAGYALTGVNFYADNTADSTAAAGISTLMTGSIGNDTFVSGAGSETMYGGAGQNTFLIDATTDGVGGTITLADFGAGSDNLVGFLGYTQSEIQTALDGATTVIGSMGEVDTVITLSDKTTVTFVGVSSLSGHIFGGS